MRIERTKIIMTQIEFKNVSLGYNGKTVTKNINFSVSKGDFLCIVGENGSGKSTLVKTILRLIKPVGGIIEYNENTSQPCFGYLPQQTEIQMDFPATVKEIVMSGFSACSHCMSNRERKKLAESNMNKLGILHLTKKSFKDLSGGQQQRVFLARALCAAGDTLILDEPTSGLDVVVTNKLYETLLYLNQKDKMTVIMVSHDINDALNLATHILHIGDEQLFFGTKDEYINSAEIKTFKHIGGAHND